MGTFDGGFSQTNTQRREKIDDGMGMADSA